jgi:hypothetical protein
MMGATECEIPGALEKQETPRVRPLIRTICGEAWKIRGRLLTPQIDVRGPAVAHARKWLSRTSARWPYERLLELTRHELDILAGCLWRVASAMGEEPEPYRRLRSNIGRRLGVPTGEFEDEAELGNPDPLEVAKAVAAQQEIKQQLQRNFRADDEAGYLDRRRRLRLAFRSVPKSFASSLLERLLFNTGNPVTKLFRYKLHPATQSEMINILKGKLEVI